MLDGRVTRDSGPAVFASLGRLRPGGAAVVVHADRAGVTYRGAARWTGARRAARPGGPPPLSPVTCGVGRVSRAGRRLVVDARLPT